MATSVGPSVGEERLDQVAPVVTTTGVDHAALQAETAAVVPETTTVVVLETVTAAADSTADNVAAARVGSPLVGATATATVSKHDLTNRICPIT
jgi:hypothetical protein